MVLAYQTDRNCLVGLVRFVRHVGEEAYFQVVEEVNVKVRPLKKADPAIAAIPAFRPGPIRTLYAISERDALKLMEAARGATAEV
jgi:hypothetical protein